MKKDHDTGSLVGEARRQALTSLSPRWAKVGEDALGDAKRDSAPRGGSAHLLRQLIGRTLVAPRGTGLNDRRHSPRQTPASPVTRQGTRGLDGASTSAASETSAPQKYRGPERGPRGPPASDTLPSI